MKLSLLFIALVTHAKANQDVLGVKSDMIYVPQETKYTFNVLATDEPTDTISGAALVNGCLASSYNAIHDPTKYFVQAIIPQSETVVPVPPSGSSTFGGLRAVRKPFFWSYYGNVFTATCRLCMPDFSLTEVADMFDDWEAGFCACLASTSDSILKTASGCSIARSASKEDAVAEKKEERTAVALKTDMIYVPQETKYTFNVLATEEPTDTISGAALVNECLASSYNAIHDPTKYFVQAIIPQSETVVPVPPSGSASVGELGAVRKPFFWSYYGNVFTATCRLCMPDFSLTEVADMFDDWEAGFCACLASTSDSVLKTASGCSIARSASKEDAVAEKKEENTAVALKTDMIYVPQETKYTFNVLATDEPTDTISGAALVNECLATSYNAIHDPTKYFVQAIIPQSETVVPVPPNGSTSVGDLGAVRKPFFWSYYGNVFTATCRLCMPDFSLTEVADMFDDWEAGFCACLASTSDSVLKTASGCSIARSASKEDAVANKKEENTAVALKTDMIYVPQETKYTFNVLATDEPTDTISGAALVNGCLASSYNAIHDPTKYFVQAIIPQSETVVPVPPSGSASVGDLGAVRKPFFWSYYGNVFTATCRLCMPDFSLTEVADMFDDWEAGFCACLASTSDSVLKTASGCSIARSASKEDAVADKKEENTAVAMKTDMIYVPQETKYTFNVLATEEPTDTISGAALVNECLASSYNAIHDPTKYFVQAIIPQSETVVPVPPSGSASVGELGAVRKPFFWSYYGNVFTATCRLCMPDFSLTEVADMFDDWEAGFCACLGSTSDSVLKTASGCSIARSASKGDAVAKTKVRDVVADINVKVE